MMAFEIAVLKSEIKSNKEVFLLGLWNKYLGLRGFDISRPAISLLDLHLFRIIFGVLLIRADYKNWSLNFKAMNEFPSWNPIPLFEYFGIERMNVFDYQVCALMLIGSLCLTVIGWKPRFWLFSSCILFFLVHGQLLSLTKSPVSNYVFHSKNIVVFVLLILAMDSNVGKRSFLTHLFIDSKKLYDTKISSHSFHLILISYGMVYLGATYIRFLNNGFQWMDGFTLKSYFLESYFSEGSEVALKLSKHHYVVQILSILTTLFEGSFMLLLIFFRPYLALFAGGILMHLGIFWIMKIDFLKYYGYAYWCFLFFSPIALGYWWNALISKGKQWFSRRARY